ncbi:amino acid adenylation domain-containing protein [Erwinia psidii]|nr:non-ribosomal peptide synthetase [Erwinia psidii]MCX8963169.1 amino acid adenylation domain-containing protein [Erwinia psidii]
MTEIVPMGYSGTEQLNDALRQELASDLRIPAKTLAAGDSLLKLGLDSIRMMAWLHRLRKRGHRIKLKDLYQQPTLAGWSRLLADNPASPAAPAAVPTPTQAHLTGWPTMTDQTPFALTPVQHAYLVGRAPHQTLGGVGCHLYQEFDGTGLEADTVGQAVSTLIERHPMLTVSFLEDGRQQYRPTTRWRGLTLYDLQTSSAAECESHLQAVRERNGHRVLSVEKGENIDFQLTLLPGGRHRLHADIDLLVMDAASFSLVFDELAALLRGERLPPVSREYDFCSYLAHSAHENQHARKQAEAYWLPRLSTLPDAPRLPLACEPEQAGKVRITRQRHKISAEDWAQFSSLAAGFGITPTMALATCFSAVLARWCSQPRLLLNLTLFDRQPLHPSVARMIADFTNILLLDIVGEGEHFAALAQANQHTFTEAFEHRHLSGVELLRELRKTQGAFPHGAPVVFTSNLGQPLFGQDVTRTLGEPGWGISQTPQVWIDHLAFEHNGEVVLQWDSNEALFPPGLIGELFRAYVGLVQYLIAHPQAWQEPIPDLMPAQQREIRDSINNVESPPAPAKLLHDGFWQRVQTQPDAVALLHGASQLSYGELARQAQSCAGAIVAHGVQPGDRVAISMSRGPGQIIAVLAVLLAGAVYVPVSHDQPLPRREAIYRGADVKVVLTCRRDATSEALEAITLLAWQDAIEHAPLNVLRTVVTSSPAYIIYTSGSTGQPKGVIISHQGALNTCHELNRRYALSANDRVLALSALHFDLSVYDIFGLLSAGGALVLVDDAQRRDPAAWCDAIERHGVTLWNSVPALFDMMLTWCDGFALRTPEKLRLVMLSGDWIGLDLPARYREFRADGQFVAMGGATEASIWSNIHDVNKVSPAWRSIPYGYPLARQKYRVADSLGRDCPDWVPGELWIGGMGVALGYFNDPQRTEQQFVMYNGERWYRTGDMGCYWPDGMLEFLGRRDKQVKVAGYRIELGEIDAALLKVDGIKSAVAVAQGEREKTLAAFVVPQGTALLSARHADAMLPADYASLVPDFNAVRQAIRPEKDDMAQLVAGFLWQHLCRQGVDFTDIITISNVAIQYGVQPEHRLILARWLEHLCEAGFLRPQPGGAYRKTESLPDFWHPSADHPLSDVASALSTHHQSLEQILRGERAVQTLLNHPFWAPEQLLLRDPSAQASLALLVTTVTALAKVLGRPVRLHEVGARSATAAIKLLQQLDAGVVEYTAWDESAEMVLRASAHLQHHGTARRWHKDLPHDERHQADLLLANNALHRLGDDGIRALLALAAPSALIWVQELSEAACLTLVSSDLLAGGEESGVSQRLHTTAWWQKRLEHHGMRTVRHGIAGDMQWLLLSAPETVWVPDSTKLSAALHQQLPGYMVPQRLIFVDTLPLTANGKVDQRALLDHCTQDRQRANVERQSPASEAERAVAALWRDLLKTNDIWRDSHFFRLGGDSLLATRLTGELSRVGYQGTLGDLFDFPTLGAFAATLRSSDSIQAAQLRHDAANRYKPFPLTDVQQAYLVGRRPGFSLGGVGSHFFVEFSVTALDVAHVEQAVNQLVHRHDALRTVVRDDMQLVLPEVPPYVLPCHQVPALDGAESVALRERLARQVLDPTRWPVFDIQAVQVPGHSAARLMICLDNLMLDGLSMQILLAELESLCLKVPQTLPELEIGFRDYQQYVRQQEANPLSQAYWSRRLENLPAAPCLPLRCEPAEIDTPHFTRLSARLNATEWQALKTRARDEDLTPSALLLSAWCSILSAWARQTEFCVNLTLFDRQPLHPQIEQVLGDFTTLLLLAWQPVSDWRGSAQRLQQRLRQDLLHRDVSAIQVMRQLAQRNGEAVAMPVVFTSALGFEQDRFLAESGWMKPTWGLSHTPQVWLDHQVYESEGELRFNWDYVDQLFAPQQIAEVFEQYVSLLRRLATDSHTWQLPLQALVPPLKSDGLPRIATRQKKSTTHPASRPPDDNIAVADSPLVRTLCNHFQQVTGQPVRPRQTFFDAGATSLKLVRLHLHLTQHGYVNLQVTDLFAYPSPLALATHLEDLSGDNTNKGNLNDTRRDLLAQRKTRAERRRRSTS